MLNNTDCNDTKSTVHPGAKERTCNNMDDNCDGRIDETRPKPTITVTAGNLDLCVTGSATLSTDAGPFTYQWNRNNQPIAGATHKTYKETTTGTYTVQASRGDGCSNTSQAVTVINTCQQIIGKSDAANNRAH